MPSVSVGFFGVAMCVANFTAFVRSVRFDSVTFAVTPSRCVTYSHRIFCSATALMGDVVLGWIADSKAYYEMKLMGMV